MATSYSIFTNASDEAVATRAKKDSAIAYGEKLGVAFRVVTDSGTLVHEGGQDVDSPEQEPTEAPAPEQEPTEAPEPAVEPDEDLIGDQPIKKFDLAAMKSKIAKLLAKAEKTDNVDEREVFTAKAEKLMIRLGIQRAELEASGEVKAENIIEERLSYPDDFAFPKGTQCVPSFVNLLGNGYGDLTVFTSANSNNREGVIYIVGHRTDVNQFKLLLTSLQHQAMVDLHAWQKANPELRRSQNSSQKYAGSRSFLLGFADKVRERLEAMRAEVVEEEAVSESAALVLASKAERVEEWVGKRHGGLKSRSSNRSIQSLGAEAGRKAGEKANIGEKSVGGKKGELQ